MTQPAGPERSIGAGTYMTTCEEHDGVVVYNTRRCPVCCQIEELKSEITELRKERAEAEEREAWQTAVLRDMEHSVPEAAALARLRVEGES